MRREKNIKVFDSDVDETGSYLYSKQNNYSARIATKRQSDEIIKTIKKYFPKNIKILDVGCGDGTYSFDILKRANPKYMLCVDPAKKAITAANKKIQTKDKKRIKFIVGDIYKLNKPKIKFDLIVIRGVLHHLYEPEKAIKRISKMADSVLIIEPNGFNPVLKIIENVSEYHIKHEEKSYWPPLLNSWFEKNGLPVKKQVFFSIVPYFCSKQMVKILKSVEPIAESLPFIRNFICGTNLALYSRTKK